jgi:hypothetical protein
MRETWVAASVKVTAASGIRAPEESVTVPWMLPAPVIWAVAFAVDKRTAKQKTSMHRWTGFIFLKSPVRQVREFALG